MIEQYPFFVYGTLIPGQPNDHFWQDCIGRFTQAHLPNGRLYDMGAFPMLLEEGSQPVEGMIMFPHENLSDKSYQLLVQRLDNLENYNPNDIDNSPYYRVLRNVLTNQTQPHTAWVYLGRPKYTKGRPPIPGNSWVHHSANAQDPISVWWQERGEELLFGENEGDW